VNWALAALTVLGAVVVMVYFFGAVMSTAACSQNQCPNPGPNWISPDVLLALLGADIGILAVTVAQ
jgi:hypothetical protein